MWKYEVPVSQTDKWRKFALGLILNKEQTGEYASLIIKVSKSHNHKAPQTHNMPGKNIPLIFIRTVVISTINEKKNEKRNRRKNLWPLNMLKIKYKYL